MQTAAPNTIFRDLSHGDLPACFKFVRYWRASLVAGLVNMHLVNMLFGNSLCFDPHSQNAIIGGGASRLLLKAGSTTYLGNSSVFIAMN